ncbi:MAG: hypothetical protein PHT07_23075 [Paludibacter sp.]|nr:hypothetical protein [Paludibacter sp.]
MMGREVRRVPPNWEHPTKNGEYVPLFEPGYEQALAEWEEQQQKWEEGFRRNYFDGPKWIPKDENLKEMPFEEWHGVRPEKSEYMPSWKDSERTHYQMYETTSEGTPISPVMKSPEELARWLADNKASAFGDMTASYEEWFCTIKRGSAPSMILQVGDKGATLKSGVESCHPKTTKGDEQ